MDKSSYALLFRTAVRRALQDAGHNAVTEPVVEFHGKPNPARLITLDEALDHLWLSADQFYQIVDVGAFRGDDDPPVMFVRLSGHKPGAFADTWEPDDLGPFKVIGPAARGSRA